MYIAGLKIAPFLSHQDTIMSKKTSAVRCHAWAAILRQKPEILRRQPHVGGRIGGVYSR